MTQEEALDILKLGHNVYLTGFAGTGKTYLLNQYINYLRTHDIDVAITASTGIAASHMNGITIHSWSGLGIKDSISPYDLEAMEEKRHLWQRFERVKVLIIDEISMLHHFRLDLVDKVLRSFKRNNMPFGGIQVILCGDFFQLPPVARRGEDLPQFVYKSQAWDSLDVKVCYLQKSFRQHDESFVGILNAIRSNTVTTEVLNTLLQRHNKRTHEGIKPTKLYTHNVDVDDINMQELQATSGTLFTYDMNEEGRTQLAAALKNSCLAPEQLALKTGAQVMFVKNNYEAGYVNGTLGTVIECRREYPIIKTVDNRIIKASPVEWTIDDDGKRLAGISQVPLRLAWAITIHKSQGMTLDAAEIDLSKSFEKGMGYVALSRLRSLDALTLLGINDQALEVDEEILEFDKKLMRRSEEDRNELQGIENQKGQLQNEFLQRILPKKKVKKIETHLQTKVYLEEKMPLYQIADKRGLKIETIIDHIETLVEKKEIANIDYLKDECDPDRLAEVHAAFKKSFKKNGDYRLGPVKTLLGSDFTYEEIRLARLFLK